MLSVRTITNDLQQYSNEDAEKIITGIYLGTINIYDLPDELYAYYVLEFTKALDEMFADISAAEEVALRSKLYENIQLFSGAKTFQLVRDIQGFLYVEGKIVEFTEFRKKALEVLKEYNTTWLRTEYEFVTESARAAKRWVGIWRDRELLPLLEYVTLGDDRVRPTHKALDGVKRKVTDSFWNNYYPPWDWRCRCTTKSYEEGEETPIFWNTSNIVNVKGVNLPPVKKFFRNNPGKTGKIFNGFHPYFKEVPEKYREWAKRNFGLPFVKVTTKYGK